MELLVKNKGGGICFCIHSGWCNNVTVIKQYCSPYLERLFHKLQTLLLPREFASFILVSVNIPRQGNVQEAQGMLTNQWSGPSPC